MDIKQAALGLYYLFKKAPMGHPFYGNQHVNFSRGTFGGATPRTLGEAEENAAAIEAARKPKARNKIGRFVDMGSGMQAIEINGKDFPVTHLGTGKFTKNLTERREYIVRVAPDYNSSGYVDVRSPSVNGLTKKLQDMPFTIVSPQRK